MTLFGFLQRLRERHFLNFLDCWWSSLVSLCNWNRWLAVISSNLTDTDVIVVSSEDSRKAFVYVFFFYSILKSVLLGGFSLGDRQLYLLHAFTPISGSGLKPTILFEYHGSWYAAPKLNSSLVTNVLFVQLEDVEGVLMRIELDPPSCILGIFCHNFHWTSSVRSFNSLPFFS